MIVQPISKRGLRPILLLALITLSTLAGASNHVPKNPIEIKLGDCVYLLDPSVSANTLRENLRAATRTIEAARQDQPDPNFIDVVQERTIEWKGTKGLRVFDKFLPNQSGIQFLRTPSVNAESPWVSMRISPETGGFLNVAYPWRGKTMRTTVYFNKPVPKQPADVSNEYLIGDEHEYVIMDMHGGGTPSAESGNGSSKGSFFVKRGIPFISIDLPGHGKGTRAPMNGLDDVLDNYLALVNQIVHPDVKIFMTGHSWGGEIAIYAHQNSRDPRLHRVMGFIPQSPPGDLSLGGTEAQKVKLEEALEKRLLEDPAMQELIADADYDFMSNIVRSGKVNPVASWFTQATQMDYSFEVKPDGHRHLKPALILMGKSDGLVYVGREEAFEAYMSRMVEKGRFVVMGKGKTFKGDGMDTGHQIFDKEIKLRVLLDELGIKPEELGKNFDSPDATVYEANMRALLFMGEVAGSHFGRVDYEGDQGVFSTLYKMFLLYSNNFAFRQYIENTVEYVRRPLENATELQYRRKVLAKAVEAAKKLMDEKDRKLPRTLAERMKKFDETYGVSGGKDAAKKELATKYSPEREAALRKFLKDVEAAEATFRRGFEPAEYNEKMAELKASVEQKKKTMRTRLEKKAGPGKEVPKSWFDEDLFAQAESLFQLDEASKQIAALRRRNEKNPFPEYQETVARILKNVGIESEEALAERVGALFPPIEGLSQHEQTERKKILESAFQQIKSLEKLKRSLFSDANNKYVNDHVEFPKGVETVSQARWELALDHSEARRRQLKDYLNNYDTEEQRVRMLLTEEYNARIDALEYPDEIHGFAVAEAALTKADAQLADRYVPQTKNHEHYDGMVKAITSVQEKADALNRELERLNTQIEGLKKKRDGLIRSVNGVYDRVVADPFSDLLPKEYVNAIQAAEDALMVWIDKNKALSKVQSDHLLQAKQSGKTAGWAMSNPPANIGEFYADFEKARSEYYEALAQAEQVWFRLAITGAFKDSDIKGASKVQGTLVKLLGEHYFERGELGENSIEGKLRRLEEEHDHVSRLKAVTHKELSEKKMVYLRHLKDDPHAEAFYEIIKVRMRDLLDQDFLSFWNQINHGPNSKAERQALMAAMSNWESKGMWTDVLRENDRAHPDWYPEGSFLRSPEASEPVKK